VKKKDEAIASLTRRRDKCLGPENQWELRQSDVSTELVLKALY